MEIDVFMGPGGNVVICKAGGRNGTAVFRIGCDDTCISRVFKTPNSHHGGPCHLSSLSVHCGMNGYLC